MFTVLLFTILQVTLDFSMIVQIANYILLALNGIYSIGVMAFIGPTYKDHKLLVEDYKSRTSPIAIAALKELKDNEREEIKEIMSALKDIKHDIAQIRSDKQNLTSVFNNIESIQDDIHTLTKNKK